MISRDVISILMPSLNQADFIVNAIHSVLEQSDPMLELVVADGGSTDGTVQILQNLQETFGLRMCWFSEKDKGPADAVNKALALARGRIIGWLNADDLYCPGAVGRAVAYLEKYPDCMMVYGEAEHIDAEGRSLGRYPTVPSCRDLQQFHRGCFICQPTVFLRREVFDAVGVLDETLKTAFDFDLWLRVYLRFADQVGYLADLQAYSRLHNACITRTQRRQVAVEGLQVVSRYLGHPSADWLFSYVDEVIQVFPFETDFYDIRKHLEELVHEAVQYLGTSELARFRQWLADDKRLMLAAPGVCVMVHPDGWAGRVLYIKINAALLPEADVLVLHCRRAWPFVAQPLSLSVRLCDETGFTRVVTGNGTFRLKIPLSWQKNATLFTIRVDADAVFIPRHYEAGSTDTRQLSFKVEEVTICHRSAGMKGLLREAFKSYRR